MPDPLLRAMFEAGDLVPVCPEVMGGLSTPRDPAEIVSENPFKIATEAGVDVTSAYRKGADQALAIARAVNAKTAILKSKSPSCGSLQIYDGTFRRTLIPGQGLAARTLKGAGLAILNETEARERFEKACTRILILRHAQSVFSADDRGRGLTDVGTKCAADLADRLADGFEIQAIYASPYKRAYDTARPWAEKLDLEVKKDERLRERKVAAKPIDDFLPFAHDQWLDFDYKLTEGESLKEVAGRGREALLEIEKNHRGQTVLLATHGTWMGALFHDFDPAYGFRDWECLLMPDLYEMVFYKGIWVETRRVMAE